jgi:membrane protein implicated in regulation of membrane protease activity
MSYAWIVWLIIAAIFIGAEVLTPGFFLLWFGIGALVAMLLALLGVTSAAAQVVAFLIVSILLLIASRTIFERFLSRSSSSSPDLKTGVEKMIGQVGMVVEPSRGAMKEAAVKVYGSVWTALPIEGEKPLNEGETVTIEHIEGNTIYVRRSSRRALRFSETSEEAE